MASLEFTLYINFSAAL